MADEKFKVPTDIMQIPIVWRYELLRYLRSWRLAASVIVVVIVLSLIFFLPPALGHPYSGTDKNRVLEVISFPGPTSQLSAAAIPRLETTVSHLVIYVNDTVYPSSNWQLVKIAGLPSLPQVSALSGTYAVLFNGNLSGNVVTATYDWKINAQTFDSLNVQFASFLIIICATFFGADSIVGEYSNRTGYLLFPNPVKRGVMFFGKFASSMTAGGLVVSLLYIGITGLSFAAAGGVDDKLGLSYLFAIEYLLAAMAIGYVVSSILKGTTGAIILTFFMLVLILPIIDGIAIFTGTKIAGSLTFSAGVISFILQSPYPTDTSQTFNGFTLTQFYPDPLTSAIVMFVYAVVAVLISLVLFKRKQLLG